MLTLHSIDTREDIPDALLGTPIERLFSYQNLGQEEQLYHSGLELLIIKCMDYRVKLALPEGFAHVIRTGGGYARNELFYINYALQQGGIKAIAVISHNDCVMAKHRLQDQETYNHQGIESISVDAPSIAKTAQKEIAFAYAEAHFLSDEYRNLPIEVVPMLYDLHSKRLYLIKESQSQQTSQVNSRHQAA